MASSAPSAQEKWHDALKLRKHLMKQLERLQGGNTGGSDASQFENIEKILDVFRLACVSTIFLDFKYAVAENTEEALWIAHTSINTEYRRVLGLLTHSSHAAERRKIEKLYNIFLRIAQKFYNGYIQRLAARYDVQELKNIAESIEVERLSTEDRISPVAADLRDSVLKSCRGTLIRLGDLTRYRLQAKHKNSGFDTALTFYALAHHLKPDSGFALHQMGIVHLDQANHLDVVYHFYRSWAVKSPHPNVKQNLESEFKALQLPNNSRSRRAPIVQDPFTMWFLRLHALFYKGEVFQQQKELEEEVMHRLGTIRRNADSVDSLLKMAIINIAAQHLAGTKYLGLENQTETFSRFYQYTLRFNARFILTFCGVLETELKEDRSNSQDIPSQLETTARVSLVDSLLPVLRVYTMWLVGHRQEMSQAAGIFGGLVPMMIRNLAKVFTLLCVESDYQDLAPAPYLLLEDTQIVGLSPLGPDRIPETCRFYCNLEGNTKSFYQSSESRLSSAAEKAARIIDILRGAYFLAEDKVLPLNCKLEETRLIFEYGKATQEPSSSANDMQQVVGQSSIETTQSHMTEAAAQTEIIPPEAPANVMKQTVDHVEPPTANKLSLDTSVNDNYQLSPEIDDADNTVINMLTPFLKPPTPEPREDTPQAAGSAHSMRNSLANEVFGMLRAEPTPTKVLPQVKFDPLPWSWFNSPNPNVSQEPTSAGGKPVFNGYHSATQSPIVSSTLASFSDDPFSAPGRHHLSAFTRNNSGNAVSPSLQNADWAHKEHLLKTFGKAGAPRSSSFGQWSGGQPASRPMVRASSAWGAGSQENTPFSSGLSLFSHPSSLYHGTPVNGGLGFSPQAPVEPVSNDEAAFYQEEVPAIGRQFQMDQRTSNYDEAILKAAYQGQS